jgi:malate dehydrogenase (oxaloacetate-decarboxylating)(NADP+)
MNDRDAGNRAQDYPTGFPRGLEILYDPIMNKRTACTHEERDALGLLGLLPPRVFSQDDQVMRVMENFQQKCSDLERYIQMMALLDRNETLFYRVIMDHIEMMMPIIHTPTVGEACRVYGHIFRKPKGIFLSAKHKGRFAHLLRNWSHDDVRVIVVTDGERIFELGDLGAYGMGTAVGKLILHTACAGVLPVLCLPVTLDVGTNNEELQEDPLYIGIQQRRLHGKVFDEIIEEFVRAVEEVFPGALIQFENMATDNAFRLLKRYRKRICIFNDDIQGRAAVTLAGLYAAFRITKRPLEDQRILFLGAGEGGIGIADLIVSALKDEGLSEKEARSRCWLLDSKGLVVKSRDDLADHKLPFAHDHAFYPDLMSAIGALKPTTLIGISGKSGTFTEPALRAMGKLHERPIIFALSNPNAKGECTAQEAYAWTRGRGIFAGTGPANRVMIDGNWHLPGQVNTAYVSPGVVLGVVACDAAQIIDEMFLAAARALFNELSEADLEQELLFPPLKRITEVSAAVASAAAEVAYDHDLARKPKPKDFKFFVKSQMYEPIYQTYV